MTNQEELAKAYRNYREECGLNDPIMLDEIEEAYFQGISKQADVQSDDLDVAIGEYCSNPDNFITFIDTGFAYRSEEKDDIPLIIKAIKFGAQWQRTQNSISLSNDIEEAAEDYGLRQGAELKPFATKFFKTGAQWYEQQMLKNSITTIIQEDDCGDLVPTISNLKNFEEGDKVKVIIIKQ